MVIIWGSSLYGKVDEVPGGLFHVATKFGHIYYLPLIPTETLVVLNKSGDSYQGVRIGMNFKSVLMAWLRAGLILACLGFGIAAVATLNDSRATTGGKIGAVAAAISCIIILIATYRFRFMRYASYRRAHQLAEQIGLHERARILLDLAYGVISEDEANAALQGLEQMEAEETSQATSDATA